MTAKILTASSIVLRAQRGPLQPEQRERIQRATLGLSVILNDIGLIETAAKGQRQKRDR